MAPATAAAQYNANLGHDFTLADAHHAEHLDTDDMENVDAMMTEQRQALNPYMAKGFGI
jgi:hypothetical protein